MKTRSTRLLILALLCALVLAAVLSVSAVSAPLPVAFASSQQVLSETVIPSPTSTPTSLPPSPEVTVEVAFVPTLVPMQVPTDTEVPTLSPSQIQCEVPVSIMLHWYDAGILEGLLNDLQYSGYHAVTYSQWYYYCERGYDTSQTVVLSFDDAGPSGIYSDLLWMLDYTHQRGFVGVVGVVAGDLSPENWAFLSGLLSDGWEVANHSKTHPEEGLPFLSRSALYEDILYVQNKVYEGVGAYPTALILPGGTYNNDKRIDAVSEELGINFIVGIGTPMDPWISGEGPYYVGRVAPPQGDPYFTTWTYALRVFGPQK